MATRKLKIELWFKQNGGLYRKGDRVLQFNKEINQCKMSMFINKVHSIFETEYEDYGAHRDDFVMIMANTSQCETYNNTNMQAIPKSKKELESLKTKSIFEALATMSKPMSDKLEKAIDNANATDIVDTGLRFVYKDPDR